MDALMLVEGDAAALERALAREIELWEAYKNRDIAALERLIDPLALDVGPGGVLGRSAVVNAVKRMEILSYEITALALRASPSDEIVTYLVQTDGRYEGLPFPARDVWCSSVWRAVRGAWRLVHRHEAPRARSRDESRPT